MQKNKIDKQSVKRIVVIIRVYSVYEILESI